MKQLSRRNFLLTIAGTGTAATGFFVLHRCTGYPEIPGWQGKILSSRQAYIIMAACEVILPSFLNSEQHRKVAENIDRYLYTFPKASLSDIRMMLGVVEHLTPIGFNFHRFTKLNTEDKNDYLNQFNNAGGQLRLCYRGIRDLCMLGYYQLDESWKELSYPGPLVGKEKRTMQQKYASLMAAPEVLPESILIN